MSTTFESMAPGELSYDDGLMTIVTTLNDLVEYLAKTKLPDDLELFIDELKTSIDKLGALPIDELSYADINTAAGSPQEAAAKAVRVFRVLGRLMAKTCIQAATNDPVKAIQLRGLQERIDEQSVVFERYVWLGTTRAS